MLPQGTIFSGSVQEARQDWDLNQVPHDHLYLLQRHTFHFLGTEPLTWVLVEPCFTVWATGMLTKCDVVAIKHKCFLDVYSFSVWPNYFQGCRFYLRGVSPTSYVFSTSSIAFTLSLRSLAQGSSVFTLSNCWHSHIQRYFCVLLSDGLFFSDFIWPPFKQSTKAEWGTNSSVWS